MRTYRNALENLRTSSLEVQPTIEPPRPASSGFMPRIMGMEAQQQASLPIDPMSVAQRTFQSITQAKGRYQEKMAKLREQEAEKAAAPKSVGGFMERSRPQPEQTEDTPYNPLDTLSQGSTRTPPREATGRGEPIPDFVTYRNQGAIRNQPASDSLIGALSFLGDMGIRMEVVSGGQPPAGSSEARFGRIGSNRHDDGNAVDVDLYIGDRKLNWNNPADLPILQEIVTTARRNDVTGIGAGDDYMGPGRFHFGFGPTAVWGAGGSRNNAPSWLVEAFEAGGR